jgi:hypothetical protein
MWDENNVGRPGKSAYMSETEVFVCISFIQKDTFGGVSSYFAVWNFAQRPFYLPMIGEETRRVLQWILFE